MLSVNSFSIITGVLQAILILAVAPFYSGLSRVLRAKMHSRKGPSIFQNYRDLFKLMKRQEIIPEQAGWAFQAAPYVTMISMLLAAMLVPILTLQSPFGWIGDLILLVYLFVLARFFFSTSGLSTGSTFGGVGSRRDLLIASLTEPTLLLVLFVMALLAGSTNLGAISTGVASGNIPYFVSVWLGMLAFGFATYVEMGKLPFDLSEAEQEVQEGPLTEYSGHSLALFEWGIYIKQLVIASLFVAVFFPFGTPLEPSILSILIALPLFFLKTLAFFVILAVFENSMARLRFIKTPSFIWIALGAALFSFVFYLVNI
jgi:hydrogenase-4 component C